MLDRNWTKTFLVFWSYYYVLLNNVDVVLKDVLYLSGGMQDWNYLNTNCFEVTIELGCVKFPKAKDLPGYWEQNRKAMLQFIHQVTHFTFRAR